MPLPHKRVSSLQVEAGLQVFASLLQTCLKASALHMGPCVFADGHWLLLGGSGPAGRAVPGWGNGSGRGTGH